MLELRGRLSKMYYQNRAEAGRLLAEQLEEYKHSNTTLIALSSGAVIVGAQIAMQLHAGLSMLLTEDIIIPGELDPLAVVSSDNTFTFNTKLSVGELEMMQAEYFHVIEGQRIQKLRKLHSLQGSGGEISRDLLKRKTIILVSDGLNSGLSLDLAYDFLKPIEVNKLIIATPFASVHAVDRMHLIGDKLLCLDVKQHYLNTNHYYEDNTIPPINDLFKIIDNISVHWN